MEVFEFVVVEVIVVVDVIVVSTGEVALVVVLIVVDVLVVGEGVIVVDVVVIGLFSVVLSLVVVELIVLDTVGNTVVTKLASVDSMKDWADKLVFTVLTSRGDTDVVPDIDLNGISTRLRH